MQPDGLLRIKTYVSLDTLSVHHLVDVVRCDARPEFPCSRIENFPSHAANFPHTCLLLFIQTSDRIPRSEFVVGVAILRLCIIWMRYRIWNGSSFR